MKFKKFTAVFIAAIMALQIIGCGNNNTDAEEKNNVEKIETENTKVVEAMVDPIDDNYRVMYEIFTGSFSDSDGDGSGDLRGIINRLDYLNDGNINSDKSLGIQGIWLTPIFESPSYHKYDVADYYKIDDKFGNEDDLKELITECHKRNVIVILDMVINHTSRENPWFIRFQMAHQNGSTEDEYYDYYSWCKGADRKTGITYNKIQGTDDEWYECNFSTDMPELNYDNEAVKTAVLDVAKYYLDLGVDGYRFDAVKYIYFGDNPKSVEFWKWYAGELKAYKEDIYMVGECWDGEAITLDYIEAINCFNFQMGQAEGKIADGVKGNITSYTKYIEEYQNKLSGKNSDAMMMGFIANHDMDRAAGYMSLLGNKAQMAANLLILNSGSPFIYYGEEIGMKGTRGGANTDANRRLAMLWGDGERIDNPPGADFDKSKQKNGTVVEQLENEESLLNYYKKVIAIRNRHPEIARGDYKSISVSKTVGGFEIEYDGKKIAMIHNTDTEGKTIDLKAISGFTKEYTEISEVIGMSTASLEGDNLIIGSQTTVILN